MKHQDAEAFAVAIPVRMTKRKRLTHWAELVRGYYPGDLTLFHGLEYLRPCELDRIRVLNVLATSAFTLAVADSTFNAQGLSRQSTLLDVMGFFELTQGELHEFSCDCGGYISNPEQADRIERLAHFSDASQKVKMRNVLR
jgi:hypothetical protein